MKNVCWVLLLSLWIQPVLAQREAATWCFGYRAGLTFGAACQPAPLLTSQMNTQEGCAAQSDRYTGQLLVYTDAINVWNRENQKMPNSGDGNPLEGVNRSAAPLSQGALIVPDPADSAGYYLFSIIPPTFDEFTRQPPGILRYSRIDMRLDGGRGDVVAAGKNTILADGLVGRLTAVRHTNGRDYWILTHQWNTNAYLIYRLTATGLGPADTVRIGSVVREAYGFLRASPDGRRLACSSRGTTAQALDLFDFDATTGRLTNWINLGAMRVAYGLSFSPDNSKLYVSNQEVANVENATYYRELIRQYDLRAGTPAAIITSGKSIVYGNPATNVQQGTNTFSDFYAPSLQLGLDGRLYCASNGNSLLCDGCGYRFLVINKPNEAGFACDIQVQRAELGLGTVGNAGDLPNFMQHYFNGIQPQACPFDDDEGCPEATIQLSPNPASDQITLTITDLCASPYRLRIIGVTGRVFGEYDITAPQLTTIHVGALAGGVYVAELRFANRTVVRRFVKQ